MHEENVKWTYDDDSVLNEKYGVTNTEEVHRFELYFAKFEVRRFVEFDKKYEAIRGNSRKFEAIRGYSRQFEEYFIKVDIRFI